MNFFKNKKQKLQPQPAAPVPREIEEINKTYTELCARAGQLQYKITVDEEQLAQLNSAIRNVNLEADARAKLDKEAAAKAKPVTEVPDVK